VVRRRKSAPVVAEASRGRNGHGLFFSRRNPVRSVTLSCHLFIVAVAARRRGVRGGVTVVRRRKSASTISPDGEHHERNQQREHGTDIVRRATEDKQRQRRDRDVCEREYIGWLVTTPTT
jgi:hypothetical protein